MSWFRSVRARATLAAVVVVGAALAIGAIGLLTLLRGSLREGVEASARAEASDVISMVRMGRLPRTLPATRADTFAQVVGDRGQVLASSAGLLTDRPLSHRDPEGGRTVIGTIAGVDVPEAEAFADPDGPYLLLARTVTSGTPLAGSGPSGRVTVYVAASLRPVVEATTTVGLALAGGLPVLVALVGGLVWMLSGRALQPVEAIRAEVADISGHDLHRRVPEPTSGDEVARLAQTMNEMLDRLESSADSQRRFVSDASHELRSPLAVLQATLEVSLAHPEKVVWEAVAGEALDEARRLQRLVEDLLALARADERAVPRRSEVVDLDEVVLAEGRRLRARSRVGLDLHEVLAGRVQGDPDQLVRVVHNLLDNADRHARSLVSVELRPVGDQVELVVADDGPGIPNPDRDRVFERFARLDEGRSTDDGGTGLGLAIVREIISRHGGSIEVAAGGGGARFVTRLPASEDEEEIP